MPRLPGCSFMALLGDSYVEEPATPATRRETTFLAGLSHLAVDRLLILLAAVCAIGFGILAFFLQTGNPSFGPFFSTSGNAVFTFAITLVFGVFLLVGFGIMAAKPSEGALVALAFSIVLLFFGGIAGTIAGILGLVGGLTGVLRGLKLVA